ncbi:MAG: GTP-binding protein [Rhodospirillaceae bacterium]|jgi:G3E family GTPase|nr:GTP-binding protein [Rhodospirillaceae bacterium]MBT4939652.1 GTP-binding protein [Rhodospirillaceae bacterium]MBT5940964.1 GTP-binding protein [Rhodospirillaceae bacterium]MBT7266856.1 GTP-binding protein [Rhodospirillaceae bacterium]
MDKIWVTLITGFLGSGKTTLLNNLLEHPDMAQAAVIVNEFGEIGLDYDLVERSDENIIQLANGCLCCSVKGDLIDTFRDLYIQRNAGTIPHFDRVIIETTGIADPAPILQIILTNPMVFNHFALDGVVTTVDTVNGISSLDRFPECVKQAAIADRIIITKVDLVENDSQIKELETRLRVLNPAASIIATTTEDADPSDLFGTGLFDPTTKNVDFESWLQSDAYENQASTDQAGSILAEPDEAALAYYKEHGHTPDEATHAHDPSIKSFVMVRENPIALNTLSMFLEGLTNEAGPDLLRVKGIVHVHERPDQPAVIQGAQQIFHSLDWLDSWPSDDKRTRIVFITRNIDQAYIEDTYDLIERVAERTAAAAGGVR